MPQSLLDVLVHFIREVELIPVRRIHSGLVDLDDHLLIYELARQGWTLMITENYKMLKEAEVLVALHQTRMTLFTLEGTGDDAILATGALLRDLVPAIKKLSRRGQVFQFKPIAPVPTKAYDLLASHAARQKLEPEVVRKTHHVRNWRAQPPLLDWPAQAT